MKISNLFIATIFSCFLFATNLQATTIFVNSQQSFDAAQNNAAPNDSIVWRSGTYSDIQMDISKDQLMITAEVLGGTIFTGASSAEITGDGVTFQGFQYLNGNIGTDHVVNIRASNVVFTQINIRDYTCYKYLRVREESRFVEITYCNFENRLNQVDQNILSILVDNDGPGYHKIQYCSFKNFAGNGNDEGVEPIRVGVSTQAEFISRTLVEYCYFTECDGDGELISSKATQNVYRHNTFENNTKAELVLRHGSESIIYGNFFLNGKGGVRVREGQDHYIYNNYFFNLDDRPIYLVNDDSDPLDNINIAFNTIINCSEVRLGGDGSFNPTNVVITNNIFTDPKDDLFRNSTGTEIWNRNLTFGSTGLPSLPDEITEADPELEENSEGFFSLSAGSLPIDGASGGWALLPQYSGMVEVDTDMSFDIMGQTRSPEGDKDLGCSEYPNEIILQPRATEENTGPDYNSSVVTSVANNSLVVKDFIQVNPNPVMDQINILLTSQNNLDVTIELIDFEGRVIRLLEQQTNFSGDTTISKNIMDLPNGPYSIRAVGQNLNGVNQQIQTVKFIKVR